MQQFSSTAGSVARVAPRGVASRNRAALKVSAVSVGDAAPEFALRDQSGKTVKLSAFRKQSLGPLTLNAGKNVVLFFYPADATPGCTKEACAFRDAYADFVAAGAVVLGVSSDSAESHASFADANNLPFPLLVDEDDEVRNAYGVPADLFGLIKGRQTFVIDADGNIVLSFNNQFAPDDHVKKTLAVLGA